jgi:hypothetical protein
MTMRAMVTVTAIALTAGACGGTDPAIIITVNGREALLEVEQLEVTLGNEGATQTETFEVGGATLPTTFSITAPGRTGPITISARGIAGGLDVGRGSGVVDAAAATGELVLEPADFVVNTEFAGGQFVNQDVETNGFQLTAHDGVITFGFRDDCPVSVCNQLGRRFGPDGRPLSTDLGAGTNQFRWNQADGAFIAHVGVASQTGGSSIALWDTPTGVSCRAMSADGVAAPSVVTLAPDMGADVVSAVPFPTGDYGVVWAADDTTGTQVIRSTVISSTCTTRISPFTAGIPISFANRPAIAQGPTATMIAWIENFNAARFRTGTAGGMFSPPGSNGGVLVSAPSPERITFVRIVPLGNQFGVVYMREDVNFDSTILLRRTTSAGIQIGADTVVAALTDFSAPGVVVRPSDGAIAVGWTQCTNGDGSGCGVYGRLIRPTGVPVGEAFQINTTTMEDQTDPSIAALDDAFVVAFTDSSATAPDIDGRAVRGRFIYPSYEAPPGVIGAACTSTEECGPDLVCGDDTSGEFWCHASCVPGPAACPGGGACTTSGAESFCRY